MEGIDTSVDIHVINSTGLNLVRDYALPIVSAPPDREDKERLTSPCTFFRFLNGQGSTGTMVPRTLADLTNCFSNSEAFRATGFPSTPDVPVVELPELGPGWLVGFGLALIVLGRRRLVV